MNDPSRARPLAGAQDAAQRSDGGGQGTDTTRFAHQFADRIATVTARRNATVPSGLFSDPRWDMLVALFLRQEAGAQMSVSEISSVGDIAATTGLRHLDRLEAAGLVERAADPTDGRRRFVQLSRDARRMIVAYYGAVAAAAKGPPAHG